MGRGFAQVTGWPTPIQRLDPVSCQQPQAAGAPDPNTGTAPTRPPLLYFPAVLAVRTVRIWLLTSGAKRARTADLLHAMNHPHVRRRRHMLRQLGKR